MYETMHYQFLQIIFAFFRIPKYRKTLFPISEDLNNF